MSDYFAAKRKSLADDVWKLHEKASSQPPDQALATCKQALDLARSVHRSDTHADVVAARARLALAFSEAGRNRDALQELEGIPSSARSAEVYLQIGNLHAAGSDIQAARKNYDIALRMLPAGFEKAAVLVNRGLLFFRTGAYAEAKDDYYSALRAAGEVLGAEKEQKEALVAVAQKALAECFEAMGQTSDALFAYARALEAMGSEDLMSEPQYEVRRSMAELQFTEKSWKEAERLFARCKEYVHSAHGRQSREAAEIYDRLGMCYWRMKKLRSALTYFDRVSQIVGSPKAQKRVETVRNVIAQYSHSLGAKQKSSPSLRESVLRHQYAGAMSPGASSPVAGRLQRSDSVRSIASESTWDVVPDDISLGDLDAMETESVELGPPSPKSPSSRRAQR
jgi:tetratricopeptide (TPR) repeat protein